MDDLVADGALHEHEVKLAFFLFHRVLLPCLATHKAHSGVGQHWLRTQETCKSSGSKDRPHWGLALCNQEAGKGEFSTCFHTTSAKYKN